MNPALEMPDEESVFEYYIANGTPISHSQLNNGKIERVLLSPGNNPFGSRVLNQQGIYVIDCQGKKVTIKDSRIFGTLVLLNAAANNEVDGSIVWQPAVPNFPAMMVQGGVRMNWQQQTALSESSLGVMFNPSHTPYNSVSNSNYSDTFTGDIKGIVYITGDLETDQQSRVDGAVIVGGNVDTDDYMTLLYNSSFFANAPPGFASGTVMELAPGTFKQVAY
jgi:hypothetical protein